MDAFDETEIIRNAGDVGKHITHPGPRLSILLEVKIRANQGEVLLTRSHSSEALPLPDGFWEVLPMHFTKLGLPVKCLQLRGRTILKQINDPLGFWGKMRESQSSIHDTASRRGKQIWYQQGAQSCAPNPQAQLAQKMSAVDIETAVIHREFRLSFS